MLCLVAQLCPTLCNLMHCSPPGSSVHGDSPGKNTRVGCYALLQDIFPTQGSNPGLPNCRRILYHLSHKGSPWILEWVAYPFSRGSSSPRNWTRVSWIAGRFFSSWATREARTYGYLTSKPVLYPQGHCLLSQLTLSLWPYRCCEETVSLAFSPLPMAYVVQYCLLSWNLAKAQSWGQKGKLLSGPRGRSWDHQACRKVSVCDPAFFLATFSSSTPVTALQCLRAGRGWLLKDVSLSVSWVCPSWVAWGCLPAGEQGSSPAPWAHLLRWGLAGVPSTTWITERLYGESCLGRATRGVPSS